MLRVSEDTIKLVKQALASGQPELAKNIAVATGLVGYDLQAPAKNLYPTITPLRNVIPRTRRANPGDATHWKVISSVVGSGYDAMPWVPEGQRSASMSYSTDPKAASYVTLGEEDSLTFEAESASVGFEDINATSTMRLLQKLMRKEEMAILGGNASLALGTTPTPSLSASGSGATLPGAPTTYSVICVAMTFEGWKNFSTLATGLVQSKTITGNEGQTYTLNGGYGQASAAATQSVTLGQTLFASVTPVVGAVAYAWYVGTAGAEKLEAITTINSAKFSAALAGTGQAASALTAADKSRNASLAFDGLLTWNAANASDVYRKALPTGTAGTGTALTASGRGSIVEIDDMLQEMYDKYRLSPSCIWVNSQEQRNITNKVLSNSSGPLLRYDAPANGAEPYAIMANGVVSYYYNPYSHDAGTKLPIKVHPDLPPGTLLAYAEQLPTWYQSNEVPNVAEIITRRDYYRIDWPLRTRRREFGTYAEEVLAVYAPFATAVLTNIANG